MVLYVKNLDLEGCRPLAGVKNDGLGMVVLAALGLFVYQMELKLSGVRGGCRANWVAKTAWVPELSR